MLSQFAALRPYQRAIAGILVIVCLLPLLMAAFVPAWFPALWAARLDLCGTALLGLSLALNPSLYHRELSEHPFRNAPLICKILMALGVASAVISILLYV
jgi:hypothetical protein